MASSEEGDDVSPPGLESTTVVSGQSVKDHHAKALQDFQQSFVKSVKKNETDADEQSDDNCIDSNLLEEFYKENSLPFTSSSDTDSDIRTDAQSVNNNNENDAESNSGLDQRFSAKNAFARYKAFNNFASTSSTLPEHVDDDDHAKQVKRALRNKGRRQKRSRTKVLVNDLKTEENDLDLAYSDSMKPFPLVQPKQDEGIIHMLPAKHYDMNSWFEYCYLGDIEAITHCIQDGFPIDFQDMHGWTGFMVYACAEQKQCVSYLIFKKADVRIREKSGCNVFKLLAMKRLFHMIEYIKDLFSPYRKRHEIEVKPYETLSEKAGFCTSCGCRYSNERQHYTSYDHLMRNSMIASAENKGCRSKYDISSQNSGYRLLKRLGWSEERGLGRHEDGMQLPVASSNKRDRLGLGIKSAAQYGRRKDSKLRCNRQPRNDTSRNVTENTDGHVVVPPGLYDRNSDQKLLQRAKDEFGGRQARIERDRKFDEEFSRYYNAVDDSSLNGPLSKFAKRS